MPVTLGAGPRHRVLISVDEWVPQAALRRTLRTPNATRNAVCDVESGAGVAHHAVGKTVVRQPA